MIYRYLIDLNVTKGNLTYSVVDYVGDSINATVLSNGSVQFHLDEDWEAVVLAGVTEEKEVELIYKATTVSSETATSDPSPTGNGADSTRKPHTIGAVFAILVVTLCNVQTVW